jgi:sulfoxide reductase heme-binding subunit YedZ
VWPRLFKPAVFVAAAVPALRLGYRVYTGDLGIDPLATLEHTTGRDALLLLFCALTVTPVRRLTGWNRIQSVRRMLGLWAYFYAVVHVCIYLVFGQLCYSVATCDFRTIVDDITKRRFIIAGMVSFSVLTLMALTSTKGWIRRLGRNWQRLHRLVYVAAPVAIVHFMWKEKSDYSEQYRWLAVLVVLLGIRVYFAIRRRRARVAPVTASAPSMR